MAALETDAIASGLLEEVKNYLDISWNDNATNEKISGIIRRGVDYINSTGGTEYDFTVEGQAKSLLFDYVRYVRSNALEEFWKNYKHELIALRLSQGVKQFEIDNPDV